jgi:hypothetical protein
MPQDTSWASGEHAKGAARTGPIANDDDADAPNTTFDRDALRRRREASWRMPPLASGHRDPLDCRTA